MTTITVEARQLILEAQQLILKNLEEMKMKVENSIVAECEAKNIPVDRILSRCSLRYIPDTENSFGWRVHLYIDNKYAKDITP